MRRYLGMIALVLGVAACGAPTVQEAARRSPDTGATESFGRPYPEVYAAAKAAIARAATTPEWKELRVVHDDPQAGVLVAERRLEGIIPGLRVRDLWSFYFTQPSPELTTVTFVFDSSDRPAVAAGARSWAKGHSDIFPAISEALGSPPASSAGPASSTGVPIREARGPAAPSAVGSGPTLSLARVYAILQASDEWRHTTRRRTLAGEDVVTVGDWAQLDVRDDRVEVAFPSYPAPPAYDVARLIRFLGDAGLRIDVLPGTAFRTPQ